MDAAAEAPKAETYRKMTLTILARILIVSLSVSLVALAMAATSGFAAAIGIGVLVCAAAFACGSGFGFIFGVPRVLAADGFRPPAGAAGDSSGGGSGLPRSDGAPPSSQGPGRLIASNTNLEKISDWLSTMLVGISLSQLGNINRLLVMFSDTIERDAHVFGKPGHMDAGVLPVVCSLLLILGLVAGFMFMYLNTRLILSRLFDFAERSLDAKLPDIKSKDIQEIVSRTAPDESIFKARITQAPSLTLSDSLNVMRDSLYRPGGYQATIDVGGVLVSTPAASRADFWFYLACAFGQKHREEQDGAAKESARQNVLDSVRRCIAIDASYKPRLLAFTNPQSYDNDLASLNGDANLMALLQG